MTESRNLSPTFNYIKLQEQVTNEPAECLELLVEGLSLLQQ